MHQHAVQAAHGSRDAKLKAAHVEAGRFLARMAQTNPAARSFDIDTARGLAFSDGGKRTPLSLFHIVSFAEELKKTNQVDHYEISGSSVKLLFNRAGLDGLHRFARLQRPDVPRKDSRTLMRSRLLDTFKAFEEKKAGAQSTSSASGEAVAYPKASGLLGPILQTLVHGARPPEEIARLVSVRMRVPMHKRSEPWLENGTTFDAAVTHAMNYLIGRRLLAHPARQIGLTSAGRECAQEFEKFSAEGFVEPSAPAVRAADAKPAPKLRVMTEADMLAFMESLPKKSVAEIMNVWRNAVRIVSDDTKEAYHLQSRVMIRAVENEWNERSARADLAESFRWPSPDGRGGRSDGDNRSNPFESLVEHGMLKEMGYRVGRNGLSSAVRQKMLGEIFMRSLPPVFPKPYMDQWGANGSARRLNKIADSLAAFARNAARLPGDYDEAISDWKEDLDYLHDNFYAGRFGFGWPRQHDLPRADKNIQAGSRTP